MGEKFLTHYQVLGLARTATERDVKIAYRKAAKIAHPDRGGDPALFRQITESYETLVDPAKRNAYDKSYGAAGRSTPPAPTGSAHAQAREGYRGSSYGSSARAGSTGFSGFNTHRAPEHSSTAGDPAVYFPPYEGPAQGEVPIMPRPTAAQPVHGAPRKRGLFGASSRLAREARTAQLIMQQVLPGIPAARLINGLTAPFNSGYVDHVLVSGYRIAIIGSMLVPNGAFRWDGSTSSTAAKQSLRHSCCRQPANSRTSFPNAMSQPGCACTATPAISLNRSSTTPAAPTRTAPMPSTSPTPPASPARSSTSWHPAPRPTWLTCTSWTGSSAACTNAGPPPSAPAPGTSARPLVQTRLRLTVG